jgi:hypothetical protein
MYLLNGGALVAILELLSNLMARTGDLKQGTSTYLEIAKAVPPSVFPFMLGLVLGGLAQLCAYLNSVGLEAARPSAAELHAWLLGTKAKPNRVANRVSRAAAWVGLFSGLGSLLLFGLGCFLVYQAFSKFGPP